MKVPGFRRILILAFILAIGNQLPGTAREAECCNAAGDDKLLVQRLQSATLLIARAKQLNHDTSKLSNLVGKIAANATTVDVYSQYEDIFHQYEIALKNYKQHRREYFDHVQRFHQTQQPDMISGQSSSFGSNAQSSLGIKPMKFRVNDACDQLQQLESTLIANEGKLDSMIYALYGAQQKEGQTSYAALWSEANQLAIADSALASQFNHLGIQKTAGISQSVRSLIDEANRDGAYSAHLQAYNNLSRGNDLENEIYQRSNMHGKFALSMLSRLARMKPPDMALSQAPSTDNRVYSAEDLSNESRALDAEYADVQNLFAKLEVVRKSLPPSFQKPGE